MSFSYGGTIFDKRGCYVILPASPFWRIDLNDNSAEADDKDVEVLEGPEVEVGSSCDFLDKEQDNMDAESEKSEPEIRESDTRRSSLQSVPKKKAKTDPDNKYYEVEAILDGPRKRREHLFKLCYKVRWKGYGPEADTWQPIADLANVQDMIDDFKKEKALKLQQKVEKKPASRSPDSKTSDRVKNRLHPQLSSAEDGSDDDRRQYDPVYGTVKDKFWKDLELGRHQNYDQLFSGDMYSKVKGCRRAAHTEALASIQRQQSRSPSSSRSPSATPRSSLRLLRGDRMCKPVSLSPTSSRNITSSTRSKSPKHFLIGRVHKRSNDSSGAESILSTKRSRRSREANSRSTSADSKRSSVSSVTSETMGIVTTSDLVTSPVVSSASCLLLPTASLCGTDVFAADQVTAVASEEKDTSDSDDDTEDVFCMDERSGRMTVSSETMLTVTTETKRLDVKVKASDQDTQPNIEENCVNHGSGVNAGASGNETARGASVDACGATSEGSLPSPSTMTKTQYPKRSPLDALMEAGGAVERSHDEDCLWNGACNRSDCKSNRRRNMKNGQGKENGEKHQTENENESVGVQNVEVENDSGNNNVYLEEGNHRRNERTEEPGYDDDDDDSMRSENPQKLNQEFESKPSSSRFEKRSSPSAARPDTSIGHPALQTSSSLRSGSVSSQKSSSHHKRSANQHSSSTHKSSSKNAPPLSESSGQMRRSLFSLSKAESSDSSFDEGPSTGSLLSREAVSDSFSHMDSQAFCQHVNTTSSTTSKTVSLSHSASQKPSGRNLSLSGAEVRRGSSERERPGLFSDSNSAFFFARQDSGFSGDLASPASQEQHGSTISLPTGSINLSAPGKENFSSTSSETSGLTNSGSNNRPQSTKDAGDQSVNTSTRRISQCPDQPRTAGDHSERTARKRSRVVSQPLEKIPSPNSRESDLDQRISTLTCDELEDFVEQGDEHHSQKDVGFITNADLLQAVNLSKAEVVKRAITQSRLNERKLDFEQPDGAGLTLLMRAVQKGMVAIAEMLLEHGVNVNGQQSNGVTALMIAAEQNGTCLVALLLKYGANSSLYALHSDQAETALMKAIKRQHREVVNLMLRVGVNIAPPTCTSLSALELAVERRNAHIEGIVRFHCQRLEQAFRCQILATLEGTARLMEPLFPIQCFPLRESLQFVVKFNSNIRPVAPGEGYLLFIAHTKITEKGVRCRFHGGCPIDSVTLNGVVQSPLTKEVNFVTSCHPVVAGCNILVIQKLADYASKAKLVVQAFRAKLLPC